MQTWSFYHPQELWSGCIFICIPQSLLPAAAVNPYHLITCLCIQSNEDPECWEPLELLNSEKKLSFCKKKKVENPVSVTWFSHCKKGNKMKPYRARTVMHVLLFHCIQEMGRASAKLLSEAPLLPDFQFLWPCFWAPHFNSSVQQCGLSLHLTCRSPQARSSWEILSCKVKTISPAKYYLGLIAQLKFSCIKLARL